MSKELIISANVHEKKVAILEDGVVTEFYVERRDENQGVVGNLYKGRVMKVLPGMQSAFVDIGLDRDAFLYVSDFTEFMDEEDEIDFREAGEQKQQRPDDRSRRDRGQRPQMPAHGKPAPALSAGEEAEALRIDDAVEHVAEIAVESVIPPPPQEDELAAQPEGQPGEAEVARIAEFNVHRITDEPEEIHEQPAAGVRGASSSPVALPEEDEGALRTRRGRKKSSETEEHGKTKKRQPSRRPARGRRGRQEEQTEAQPAPELTPEISASQFERITDEDAAQDTGELLKDAILQEKIFEEVHQAEYRTSSIAPEPETEWRVGTFRSAPEPSDFQRIVDESATAPSGEPEPPSATGDEDSRSPFRHVSDVVSGFYNRFRSRPAGDSASEASPFAEPVEAEQAEPHREAAERDREPSHTEDAPADEHEDREAEVRDRGPRAEFAVRRGGRGRRGRRRPDQQQQQVAPVAAEAAVPESAAETSPSEEQGETAAPEGETTSQVPAAVPETRDFRPEENRGSARSRFDRRPEQQRRPDQAAKRRPDRTTLPTISDLLHEGQEVLVQIAKEPIAKKGARITSHIALPGRYLVYMPTVNHVGVSRKIPNEMERVRLKRTVAGLREREGAAGGFIARTACAGHTEQELHDDMRYLIRTWTDIRKKAERSKSPSLVHRDLDLVQRILRDQLSEEFSAIRIDNDVEYARIVEFVNRVQPKLVKRVKLHVGNQPILEKYGVQPEIDKAVRPRVWLKSGGYIVINQTEALVAIDVNTGKFVGKSDKLEDTITRTNLEAAKEVVRQVRLRDLGGIIVIDFIDMEERKNRQRVMMALQQELSSDRAPSKILSINDFGLVAITRKRVKQSLERTLCSPCPYCQGAGMVKSAQTMCFEILEQAKAISKQLTGSNDVMLRVSPHVAESLRAGEHEVMEEIEAYFGTPVTIEPDPNLHQEQFDFAIV